MNTLYNDLEIIDYLFFTSSMHVSSYTYILIFLYQLSPYPVFYHARTVFLNMPSRAGQPVPDYAESVNLTLDQIPGTQELTGISC